MVLGVRKGRYVVRVLRVAIALIIKDIQIQETNHIIVHEIVDKKK